MIIHVTDATYLHDYQFEVAFSDGRRGIADLSGSLDGPIFAPQGLLTGGMVMLVPGGVRMQAEIAQFASLRPSGSHGYSTSIAMRKRIAQGWQIETRLRQAPAVHEITGGIVAFF